MGATFGRAGARWTAAALALALVTGFAGSPAPAAAAPAVADDPDDVENPSDPAEPPPPREASLEEKERAGTVVGIPAGSYDLYGLNDYLYTYELWRRAAPATEVQAAAELSINQYDAAAQRCDACTVYVRTRVHEAKQRDVANDLRDAAEAREARNRRQQVAGLVQYTFPRPEAVGDGDRTFIFNVWEHLRAKQPWAARTIAAAAAAVPATPAERVDFLTGVGRLYTADTDDRLADQAAGDAAKLAELRRREARFRAANHIGGFPRDDESWYLVSDVDFLTKLRDRIAGNAMYTLTYHALAIAIYDGAEAEWREFIETGLAAAALRDRQRREAENLAAYRKAVTDIRDPAVRDGWKNRAVAADRALAASAATGRVGPLIEFLLGYEKLPPDGSDLAAFYGHVLRPGTMWVFGHLGRKQGTVRKVWTAAGPQWPVDRAAAVTGELGGDAAVRDLAVLLRVGDFHYRVERFLDVDSGRSRAEVVWEVKPTAAKAGHTLRQPVAADVTGDGRTDLVLHGTDPAGRPQRITLAARADGGYTPTSAPVAAALVDGRTAAGDVDRDGRADLLTVVPDKKGARVWLSRGGPTGPGEPVLRWTGAGLNAADWSEPMVGDLDADGRPELAMLHREAKGATLWAHTDLATGTVGHAKRWTSPADWTYAGLVPAATDVNGDGRTDVVLLQQNGDTAARLWTVRSTGAAFEAARPVWASAKDAAWRVANTRVAR
ncbi:hypothetical protein GCM10010123_03140 [Pilimelia anulata]|uniref:VCBS repeat-containing protein n=1 Tax=Pilimelia anulata TaxID=53371 RepID=A0A8J3AZ15_9ACTN|nr:VCBS repeat-containing protein [Pilimelia anulata]GGJ76517.1 hypothetical protein GCM10010123_03140 [Pilimelia anulata]